MKQGLKTTLLLTTILSLLLTGKTTWAVTAEFDPVDEDKIGVTSIQLRFTNLPAARKYRFQLWDKRAGRTEYRQVDTFFQRRLNKKRTHQRITITGLKQNRDYRLRYKSIYLGDREGIWSDYIQFRTKNDSLYVYLDDEDSLPDDAQPYVVTADANYPMTSTADGRWVGEIPDIVKGDTVEYVLARNDLGARGYEAFTPDDVSYRRSVPISEVPQTREHTVTNWRLFTPDSTDGTVSTDAWPVTDRSPFVMGTTLATPYPEDITAYSANVIASLTNDQLTYVGLPYASRMITASEQNSVTTTQRVVGYPNNTELAAFVTELRQANLEPILVIHLPIDQDNEDAIFSQMRENHNHTYFGSYLTRWREAMNDGIDFAIEQNIGVVVLDTSFYSTVQFADDDDEYYFNYLLENDIMPVIGSGYDGYLTTAELSTDPDFTWYAANKIDWLGDSWYPTLSNSSDPVISDMYAEASTQLTTTYQALSDQYGKPIFFSTLGVFSIDGAASLGEAVSPTAASVDPDKSNTTYTTDTQEQADVYEAVLHAVADDADIVGVMAPDYSYTTQYDKLGNIRDKTAALVWERWAQLLND